MKILDGKHVSEKIEYDITEKIKNKNLKPGLSIIYIGDSLESKKYIQMKEKKCNKLGILFQLYHFTENDISEEKIIDTIEILNNDKLIHGIIVQLPIPEHLNPKNILNKITYKKDVDGFSNYNSGKLYLDDDPLFIPCTPYGCIKLIDYYNIEIKGKHVVMIGNSKITGLPLSLLLMQRNATVTICHKETINIKEHTNKADILISACGVPKMIKKDWIKNDCIIIDIGINIKDKKIMGDVDFDDLKEKVKYITPVPGGVGPMTVIMLLYQTVLSCENFSQEK
jgi:methylenetetrahydrofolate dehydrogenase (NADP+) / methenyltetrahydrofolate cyclohydrolase